MSSPGVESVSLVLGSRVSVSSLRVESVSV